MGRGSSKVSGGSKTRFNQNIQIGAGKNIRTYKTNEITKQFSENSKENAAMLSLDEKKK